MEIPIENNLKMMQLLKNLLQNLGKFSNSVKTFCGNYRNFFQMLFYFSLLTRLESAYSLIWGSHENWGKGGGDTLVLL